MPVPAGYSRTQIALHWVVVLLILAQFLKTKEAAIRTALTAGDLLAARRLVNGGSHGFTRFEDAFKRGRIAFP